MPRSRRLAAIFGGAMLALGVAVGAGRLGADVGGVITIGGGRRGGGGLLPAGPAVAAGDRARAVVPVAAARRAGRDRPRHGRRRPFTRTILDADSPGALRATSSPRRYELALNTLLCAG